MKKKMNAARIAGASLLSCALLSGTMAFAFSSSPAPVQASEDSDSLKIVAEIFPAYDWTSELLSNSNIDASLTLLLNKGVDLHSYQPTADDIMTIADSDVLIYVGGETDGWIEDALKEAENPNRQVVNLMELLGDSLKEEETVEGMAHERGEESEDHEEIEYDEHVWLSLRNAEILCNGITEALKTADPDNAALYDENNAAYQEKLTALDQKYLTAVEEAPFDTILFGDRFPFRYLTDDYNLTYYAAFAGCSAESEASFETIAFLANKINELSLPGILTIEGQDHRVAETIAANTQTPDMPILVMNSMQATTGADAEKGVSYLSIMESNLEILKQALYPR